MSYKWIQSSYLQTSSCAVFNSKDPQQSNSPNHQDHDAATLLMEKVVALEARLSMTTASYETRISTLENMLDEAKTKSTNRQATVEELEKRVEYLEAINRKDSKCLQSLDHLF